MKLPAFFAVGAKSHLRKSDTMKYCLTLLSAITLAQVSPLSQASAGWTDYVTVDELIPTGRHYYEVKLLGGENSSGCREDNWYYVNYEAQGADKIFDLFVDSIESRLRLRVYVTGVCNTNGYAEISSVRASPK